MKTLTLSHGVTTIGAKRYFVPMVCKDNRWSLMLPVDSAKDAHRTAKEYREDGYHTMVFKIDDIGHVLRLRDLLQNRYPLGKTKLKTVDYTKAGIERARLMSNKPIQLRLTTY